MNELRARQRYEDIAKQIEREDGLINSRTTWLLGSQALLFGGVGLLATKAADDKIAPFVVELLLLGGAGLMALGALVAARCRHAINAAHAQLMYLRGCWEDSPFLQRMYVPPFGDVSAHNRGIDYPVRLSSSLFWFSVLGTILVSGAPSPFFRSA